MKRTGFQQQLFNSAIILFGAFLTIGSWVEKEQSGFLISAYPICVLFFSIAWMRHYEYKCRIGHYIKEHIEKKIGAGWEHYSRNIQKNESTTRSIKYSTSLLFIFLQILVVTISLFKFFIINTIWQLYLAWFIVIFTGNIVVIIITFLCMQVRREDILQSDNAITTDTTQGSKIRKLRKE